MNVISILSILAIAAASTLVLEGVNVATGGDFYLASIQHLAQESSNILPASSETTTVSPTSIPQTTVIQPLAPTDAASGQTTTATPAPTDQKQPPEQQPMQPNEQPQPTNQPPPPQQFENEKNDREEFVDPREIRDVLRQIKDMRSQIKQLVKQAKKAGVSADLAKLDEIQNALTKTQQVLANSASMSGSDLRETIQDFHDNRYWDDVNKIRTIVQLPQEIKQINLSLRRVEKIIRTKSIQGLGLDLVRVQNDLNQMKQIVEQVQAHIANGNAEEAQEAMQDFYEGGHPGEIEGTIFRFRDIKKMIARVKDEAIRNEVNGILQEVVDAFNQGNYRDARETLDEYADDIQNLVNKFLRAKSLKNNREDSFSKIRNLEDLVKTKLQQVEERRSGQNDKTQPVAPETPAQQKTR